MDTCTGKVVPNDGTQTVEDFYTYKVMNNRLFAVPKDYINTKANDN